jgi:hypothetical protein
MSRRVALLFFLSLIATSAGCNLVTFEHPLVKPTEAKLLRDLYGSYRGEDEHQTYFLHVGSAGKDFPTGMMRVISVSLPKEWWQPIEQKQEIICCAEKIGDAYIVQLPANVLDKIDEKDEVNWHKAWEEAKTSGFIAHVRIKQTGDGLEFAFLDSEFIEQQISEKKLPGSVESKNSKVTILGVDSEYETKQIKVSATTEALRKFFTQHIDGKLFSEEATKWTRVK